MIMRKKICLNLIAVLVLSDGARAIDITVIQGTDIVDYQVLNSNYAALKIAGEDCQNATNAHEIAIAALGNATNAHEIAINSLESASNAHQVAIASLKNATNAHEIAIAALGNATNAHEIAIDSLESASNAHQVAIASLKAATNSQNISIAALDAATNNLPPPGTIVMYVAVNAPAGWLVCDGSGCHTSVYSRLHSIIGYSFGGGGTNFNLPNLKSRIPIGLNSSGSFNTLNKTGGYENVTLTIAQIPSHTHISSWRYGGVGSTVDQGCNVNYQTPGTYNEFSSGSSGGGLSHPNMPPYLVVNYIIKY
jgi:microcystin-dependent protein